MSSVLIVDDESGIREFLGRWLRPAGYETKEAPDAETALNLLAEGVFDVVLCDVDMPGHGGLWLVGRLRESFPAVAVVLATADDTVPPAVSMQRGVVEYLVKPFEREQVLAAVARALEWHQAAAARAALEPPAVASLSQWLDGWKE